MAMLMVSNIRYYSFKDIDWRAQQPFYTLVGLVILAVNVLVVVLFLRAIKTPAGRMKWHGFLLKVPVLNRLIQANAYAHFARTLGGLLENGVPVLSALKIVEDTVGNDIIAKEISRTWNEIAVQTFHSLG